MAKTTYLLGAGASAEALPVVENFPGQISSIIEKLSAVIHFVEIGSLRNYLTLFQDVKSDLEFLRDGCSRHMSVDTFCKMLYLTDQDKEYKRAKCTIILFFELFRYFNGYYDKRYDAFLATILKKEQPRLPNDINIISWNYDCEFERAFINYHNPPISMSEVYNELNTVHKNSKLTKGLENNFGIIKVNGTSGFYDKERVILGLDRWNDSHKGSPTDPEALFPIINAYNKYVYNQKLEPMISFAWDDDYGERKIKDEISDALTETESLVVVGYSFPYFNRDIDKYLLNVLESEFNPLLRIYIQDLDPAARQESLVELLDVSSQAKIHLIKTVKQFYLPHEL